MPIVEKTTAATATGSSGWKYENKYIMFYVDESVRATSRENYNGVTSQFDQVVKNRGILVPSAVSVVIVLASGGLPFRWIAEIFG